MADEASKKTQQGTDAALESIGQYRGAAQEQGMAALRGAQDRYQSAKETSAQKTGETADAAGQKKNTIAVGFPPTPEGFISTMFHTNLQQIPCDVVSLLLVHLSRSRHDHKFLNAMNTSPVLKPYERFLCFDSLWMFHLFWCAMNISPALIPYARSPCFET